MPLSPPTFEYETSAISAGYKFIIGVDEVGRGPLAGPVTAAAVRLNPENIPAGIEDSKALSAKRREKLFDEIIACADVEIAHATVEEIEVLNIFHASHLAMSRAASKLSADYALIDGKFIPPNMGIPAQAIVKGDRKSLSIAAASICAKVARDRIMVDLAQQYPGYGWEKNAGYPTKAHISGLLNIGVSPFHRRSFAPVHKMLYQEK